MTKKEATKRLTKAIDYFLLNINGSTSRLKQQELLKYFEYYLNSIVYFADTNDSLGIELRDDSNKEYKIDVKKDSTGPFEFFVSEVAKIIVSATPIKYLQLTNEFLKSRKIDIVMKMQLIGAENNSEKLANGIVEYDAIRQRFNACDIALSSLFSNRFDSDQQQQIGKLHGQYLHKIITSYVNSGMVLQAFKFLREAFDNSNSEIQKRSYCGCLISHAATFNLDSTDNLNQFLNDNECLFSETEKVFLQFTINSDPSCLEMRSYDFSRGTLSENVVENKKIKTTISFTIPQSPKSSTISQFICDDSVTVVVTPVTEWWNDPIFRMFSSFHIGGVSWHDFCYIQPLNGVSYSHVTIEVDKLLLLDKTLTAEGSEDIDFKEKEALLGRKHYPHKEFVIKLLRGNSEKLKEYLIIELGDLNINLFPNYVVNYIDKGNGNTLRQHLYALTNHGSFNTIRNRFFERLTSVNLQNNQINIRDMLLNAKLVSEKNLAEFTLKAFEMLVKNSIEYHGGYQYLWNTNKNDGSKPKRETDCQPYIYTLLKNVFDFMGISISREPASSNGEIDFFVSYRNKDSRLLKVCVELKLAHSQNILAGKNTQLPVYMNGERCRYGIYVILWFKGKEFDKPAKYCNSEALLKVLQKEKNNNISVMLIDCTKPISPSKL